jgi:hypothetical protein
MMTQLPNWVLYLQALSTPAIAVLAAVIGLMQWRTAHQRSALDLFEKRFETYQSAKAIIADVVRHGTAPFGTAIDFLRIADKAQFLFGALLDAESPSSFCFIVSLFAVVWSGTSAICLFLRQLLANAAIAVSRVGT